MSDLNTRIEQFRQMAQADPENELGHFSLGRAYLEAGQYAEALACFQKTISLNPNLARAYHLLGQTQLQQGNEEQAIATLTQGLHVAMARKEVLTQNEIAKELAELGAPVPQEAAAGPVQVGADQVLCSRCGQAGAKLPKPPFRNAQGQLIYDHVCLPCWQEWLAMGTKVINELRLPMNEPEAQKVYDKHMVEFLNLATK